jgi:hypothetical protein
VRRGGGDDGNQGLPLAGAGGLDAGHRGEVHRPGRHGAAGSVAVAPRVLGGQVSVFLSDLTAAVDWPLVRRVLDYFGIPLPGDDDLGQVLPAGDLSILGIWAFTRWNWARCPATWTCS